MTEAPSPVRLVIIGAGGRMGLSLVRVLPRYPQFQLHAALVGRESAALGRDSGELAGVARTGIALSSDLETALAGAGLVLDFSSAAATAEHLTLCANAGAPLLLGTTGLGPELPALIGQAGRRIALLTAANTSLGAAVLQDLVHHAARALGHGFEVRILDTHHRHKKDAPSGTALALGAAVQEALGPKGEVAYASVREGDAVGEHEVLFSGEGERLRLTHVATDRSVFAHGALRAGLWLVRQPPGSYRMSDIFKEK